MRFPLCFSYFGGSYKEKDGRWREKDEQSGNETLSVQNSYIYLTHETKSLDEIQGTKETALQTLPAVA